jgi:CBS domain-containing protein
MRRGNLKHLVVLSNGKLSGVLTSKHILENSGATPSRLPERRNVEKQTAKVGDIAEQNVHSIEQGDSVENAIRSLVEKKISSLVVTRSGRPVGIVTVRDIFEAVSAGSSDLGEDIIISGLDDYTREFREDIRAELERLENRINRFHKLGVESMTFNIKRHRAKNYEMKLRVWLTRRGVVSSSAAGFSLEGTMRNLTDNVYNSIKEKKEVVYAHQKRDASEEAYGEQ